MAPTAHKSIKKIVSAGNSINILIESNLHIKKYSFDYYI